MQNNLHPKLYLQFASHKGRNSCVSKWEVVRGGEGKTPAESKGGEVKDCSTYFFLRFNAVTSFLQF